MQVVSHRHSCGFSLIELVIVVVIIGIIGAIAVPRMSRGAKGATDAAVTANLTALRNALDYYASEHGGEYPDSARLPDLLLKYSNAAGDSVSDTKDSTHIYGPYLRAVPKLPIGENKGEDSFTNVAPSTSVDVGGWYYNKTSGEIRANTKDAEVDAASRKYSKY